MDKLKIVIVNTTDIKGGAARAAFRLHSGLRGIHTNSNYYVQYQHSKDRYTISEASNPKKLVNLIRPSIDSIPLHFYPQKKDTFFSLCWVPRVFDQSARYLSSYDIVHLHWTCNAFIPINELKHYNRPIVWTLHDMWPFTGGCHYSGACTKYKSKCGKCEQLNSKSERDLSRWTWHRKSKAFDNLNLTVVTPSQWMACCARESSLFKNKRIEVIPNGINTSVYKPVRKKLARSILNLPDSKKLILFVAFDSTSDKRKGFDLLNQALIQNKNLSPQKNALIILGPRPKGPAPILNFDTYYTGRLSDDITLSLYYSAADVMVVPSREDNLPNTVMESMSCGTPCVAFNIGGIPDMIDHVSNGYLAKAFDINDLSHGIEWTLNSNFDDRLSTSARSKVLQHYDINIVSKTYSRLYKELLHNN